MSLAWGPDMKKRYLHLSAYPCDTCAGPVIAGSTAVRESEISKETDITHVGAICLSCGHRQPGANGRVAVRHFSPVEWEAADNRSSESQDRACEAAKPEPTHAELAWL